MVEEADPGQQGLKLFTLYAMWDDKQKVEEADPGQQGLKLDDEEKALDNRVKSKRLIQDNKD